MIIMKNMSVLADFSCIAGKCQHSCCIGWEIDIDDDTYELYKGVEGDFGRRLMESIRTEDGYHSFILDEQERCPFLNEKNLCDIILNLGEDYLSDICNEHPRFYVNRKEREISCYDENNLETVSNDIGDHSTTENDTDEQGGGGNYGPSCEYVCGLGMCCEEAARLIIEENVDYGDELKRMLESASNLPDVDSLQKIQEAVDFLLELEQLGDEWGCWLRKLRDNAGIVLKLYDSGRYRNQMYLNILNYLLFRYGDGDFASFIMQILFVLSESIMMENGGDFAAGDLIELCRVYSSEIEYSDENVQKIMEWIGSNVPQIK